MGLSYVCPRNDWWNVMQRMAAEFCPTLPRKEWEYTMRPTYNRMLQARAGAIGRQYRVSNDWIISRLNITREEMQFLKVVVAKDIAADRHRARSREVMDLLRGGEAKRSAKAHRNDEILRLHAEGRTTRYIAKELGLSPDTASRIIRASKAEGILYAQHFSDRQKSDAGCLEGV